MPAAAAAATLAATAAAWAAAAAAALEPLPGTPSLATFLASGPSVELQNFLIKKDDIIFNSL